MNQINELWLPAVTERAEEVIISNAQNKSVDRYRDMLTKVFREIKRITKDDGAIAVVFHAAKATVWGAFSEAIKSAGLEIEQSSFLDKTQASFKQVVSRSAVQGDPLFLLKKSETEKNTEESTDSSEEAVLEEENSAIQLSPGV